MNVIFKNGFIRLILVTGIVWMTLILSVLIFHIWSCQSKSPLLSSICNRDSKVNVMLGTIGLISDPPHRCQIPLLSDPNTVVIPEKTHDHLLHNLFYTKSSSNFSSSTPLFGGRPSWSARKNSFKIKPKMMVNCGFFEGGFRLSNADAIFTKKCRFVVASGIFDGYDIPQQPKNISQRSKKLFCFLMVVDNASFDIIRRNSTVNRDSDGGKWVGIWRIIVLGRVPYDEPRRNGKVPKILVHRLFPETRYSIWIDGKMELVVDPLLILERYLWRGKHTFAIAQHKYHHSVYEEADAIKRRKRYARPLIDLQMRMYYYEGMMPWSPGKGSSSDVPEGAVIIREHTNLTNLFSCLWFNEVDLLTPRDQLSFGYVVYKLGVLFKFFMFPNCEYNSLFVLHPHTREHSSRVEWVKSMDEFGNGEKSLRESKGGLGFWIPYPADLSSVVLPNVTRTSKAG